MKQRTFYTADELAELLKLNIMTIYRNIKAGKLKAYKIGREFRIEKTDFGIDPLKIEVTYETSREYLVSKLLSYDAAGDQSGQIIEHEPQGAVPASI